MLHQHAASMRLRSKRWQRDSTVTGTLRISVVAKMNLACGGGSSNVLSSALNAVVRQHVHFVDNIYLVTGLDRRIAHGVDDFAHVLDAGIGRGVHLDHIEMAALHDGLAVEASAGIPTVGPVTEPSAN